MILLLTASWFVFQDAQHALSAPGRWRGRDWALACGVAGAGTALFLVDEPVRSWNLDHRSESSLWLADKFDYAGNGLWMSAGLGSISLAARLTGHQDLAEAGVVGLESWIGAGLIVQLIKHTLGRARPYAQEGPASFHGFTNETSYMSMPSGHAAVAFGGLGGFGMATGNFWVLSGCLGLATGVAWARVHQDKHWSSDVFCGAVIGLGVAAGVSSAHAKRSRAQGLGFEGGRVIYRF